MDTSQLIQLALCTREIKSFESICQTKNLFISSKCSVCYKWKDMFCLVVYPGGGGARDIVYAFIRRFTEGMGM